MNTGKIPTIHPIGNTSKITAGVFNWRITVFSEQAELDDLIVKSLFENITISWSGFILYTPLSADTVIVSLELLYKRVSWLLPIPIVPHADKVNRIDKITNFFIGTPYFMSQ
jgi:hypothetical protein